MNRLWNWFRSTRKTLNRSIFTGERLQANLHALTYVSIFTAALGVVLFFLNLASGRYLMLIPAGVTAVFGGACGVCAGIVKKRKAAIVFPVLFCAVAFVYYTVSGAYDGVAILWSMLAPIGLCYFVSVKHGILISVYYTVFFAAAFYIPAFRSYLGQFYTSAFMTRFPVIYASISAFTAIAMIQYHKGVLLENDYADKLAAEVKLQTKYATERADRLASIHDEVVDMMALTVDAKDRYTNGHSFRVAAYATALAENLGWPEEEVRSMHREAMLHDIGKIGIPDAVLNKPGRLTPEEFDVIKAHAAIGGRILSTSVNLARAADVARCHHERYDGGGYPAGLKGEDIPLHARVVTIADSYDAMRSDRVYRKGLSPDKIREELVRGRGTQFDPLLLDVFLSMADSGELDRVNESADRQLEKLHSLKNTV